VAGSLSVDRWQGTERVQLRVLDIAVPDQGPAVISKSSITTTGWEWK
jgi:single-stranded-DNA-specific exonuclease